MSSPPQETGTRTVDLTREQEWVVHHVLTGRLDDALDDGTSPPEWLREVIETVESGGRTLSADRARRLRDALEAYVDDDPPSRDVDPATAVVDRLDD